jgi:hypothetical protein
MKDRKGEPIFPTMLDKIRAIYYPPGKDLFTFEKGFKNP